MSPQDTDIFLAAKPVTAFDPLTALDDLLSTVSLTRAATGGAVSIAGQDPILPSAHRLGACIGIPIMASAIAAVAFHRRRGGPKQDLELDLRQAIHGINPGAFWHPTLNGASAPHPLVLDNPFLLTPYRTADGRWVMASGVYPHPRHRADQRLRHRLPGSSRRRRGSGQVRRRWRLVAGHGEPHPYRDVVRVARPGQSCPGRLRQRTPSPRASPLRRPQPARRRPHARAAGPILLHRARLAGTPARPQRLKQCRMAELT
jgi:hypothetical protein